MRRAALAVWIATLAPSLELVAQSHWPVDAGRLVRVTTDSGVGVGTLMGQDSGAIRVRWVGAPDSLITTVSLRRIQRLDISTGRHSNAGKGAGIGIGVGAALGLALGIGCASSNSLLQCNGSQVAQATLAGGFFGGALGLLIGAASTSERWEPVHTSGDVHVSLAPRGVGIGLSITF